MCDNLNQTPLTSSDNGMVYWCKNCRNFSVVYKTSCMMFNIRDYSSFLQLLNSLGKDDFKYEIGSQMNVILKNNCSSVGLSLTKEESQDMAKLMAEGMLLYEANRLITT